MVRTKKWGSEPCGLNVTISASCYWSIAIFTASLESQESYLTLRNLTFQITQDFFHLHSTFARLYNAAASPALRLCLAGWLAISSNNLRHLKFQYCEVESHKKSQTSVIIEEIPDYNLETGRYCPKSGVSRNIWES